MLYFPRTLALVVGLAGPAAGFGIVKTGSSFDTSTQSAGSGFIPPNLNCCENPETGELPDGCLLSPGGYDCFPVDTCENIGQKGISIVEDNKWCNSEVQSEPDYAKRKEMCSGNKILRKQKNVVTKSGDGVEFLACSWDSANNKCVLAGWSLWCTNNEVPEGCPGVTKVPEGQSPDTADVIVATKCSNKMEKSVLSVDKNGNPKYTRAFSCEQKLLDCAGRGGVKDNDGDVDAVCNTVSGVTWDDCCRAPDSARFRELEEKNEEQMAPAAEKRESRRNLQATCTGELKTMTDANGDFDGYCCVDAPGEMLVLGDQQLFKDTAISAEFSTLETCEYTYKPGEKDECACTSTSAVFNQPNNCKAKSPWPWG